MTLQAAVYQGRTAYIGFCKDCHGNGTKIAKKYSSDQWRTYLDKKGKALGGLHINSSKMGDRIAEQQANGLLPYTSVASIKEYFSNRSEIILKSMKRSEKKATKRRIFKYQARHLKDFFVEFAKDSGKVPACSDDSAGAGSKAEMEQARRIQEAERQRRAKKAERNKVKHVATAIVVIGSKKANRAKEKATAKAAAAVRQKEQKRLAKAAAKAKKAKKKSKAAKAKAARLAKAKATKAKRITRKQLASHKRKSKRTVNEQIVDLVDGKLSAKDLNKLKILLLSK